MNLYRDLVGQVMYHLQQESKSRQDKRYLSEHLGPLFVQILLLARCNKKIKEEFWVRLQDNQDLFLQD